MPNRINTTIVGTDNAANKFLSLALKAGSSSGDHSLLMLGANSGKRNFRKSILDPASVLVCTNIRSLTSNDAGRIKSFLENGGGLILFPGNSMDLPKYNTSFLPFVIMPQIEGMISAQSNGISFQNIDLDHKFYSLRSSSRTNDK